jgi:hypothetical protein
MIKTNKELIAIFSAPLTETPCPRMGSLCTEWVPHLRNGWVLAWSAIVAPIHGIRKQGGTCMVTSIVTIPHHHYSWISPRVITVTTVDYQHRQIFFISPLPEIGFLFVFNHTAFTLTRVWQCPLPVPSGWPARWGSSPSSTILPL